MRSPVVGPSRDTGAGPGPGRSWHRAPRRPRRLGRGRRRAAGPDLAAELAEEPTEAISGRAARVTIRHVGRDAADLLDVLQCVAIDPDRLQAAAWGETRVDRRLIDDLAALTREYWCLYHTLAPRTLLPATGAHLDLVCRLLEAAPLHLRRDLGLVAGEAAMLDGWLAFLVSSLPHGGRGGESWLAIALLDEAERAAGADAQHRTWLLARRAEEPGDQPR